MTFLIKHTQKILSNLRLDYLFTDTTFLCYVEMILLNEFCGWLFSILM